MLIKSIETEKFWCVSTNKFAVHFGKASLSETEIPQYLKSRSLVWLNQIHSSLCVSADPNQRAPADAHWTADAHFALGIYTADCLPIFAASSHRILAIHGGWRGLADQIVLKSLTQTFESTNPNDIELIIGPHIMRLDYEVGPDVAQKIQKAALDLNSDENLLSTDSSGKRFWANLTRLAALQALKFGVPAENIFSLGKNTFRNPELHSHRRQPGSGRNWNWCARIT